MACYKGSFLDSWWVGWSRHTSEASHRTQSVCLDTSNGAATGTEYKTVKCPRSYNALQPTKNHQNLNSWWGICNSLSTVFNWNNKKDKQTGAVKPEMCLSAHALTEGLRITGTSFKLMSSSVAPIGITSKHWHGFIGIQCSFIDSLIGIPSAALWLTLSLEL